MEEDTVPTGSQLGELISSVARYIRHHSRNIPPHQHRALKMIAKEPIRPARLAEQLNVTPRAVTDVVDALVEKGLIDTTPDPDDRRAKILEINEAGSNLLTELDEKRAEVADEYFSAITDEQKVTLGEILSALPRNIMKN
ncbi:MAG: MarR family transcriptional regulator [Flaviflexus sp.]|uniref:MarR family winged helix-turn-helix transcriptional regulator n=1 Tax=Flaviflexus sp. TaxID=1969482 RepID=UPI00352CFD03